MPLSPAEAAAAKVCEATSRIEALAVYGHLRSQLPGWRFVFAADEGPTFGHAANRIFSGKGVVWNLFSKNHVFVLDEYTYPDLLAGPASYPMDCSISLDTQAFSYIAPYLSGRTSKLPDDFKEAFEFIARPETNVDPIPYILENFHKLSEEKTRDGMYRTVRAYEVLKSIDSVHFRETGEARSTKSDEELSRSAQQLISHLLYDTTSHTTSRNLRRRHAHMYCLLLKMAAIQLENPGGSPSEKTVAFLDFQNERLLAIFFRESIVAKMYFELGQRLPFFGKIQKNRDGIFDQLKNMAWDLWHVRQCEENICLLPDERARYFFSAVLTFDAGLVQIMNAYRLKACALPPNDGATIPFYEGDWAKDMAAGDTALESLIYERYLSDHATRSRHKRRTYNFDAVISLVHELEKTLANIAQVAAPEITA
jgi:hypothetical protein